MEKYTTLNHGKYWLRYHVIFSVKYRKNILVENKEIIYKSFNTVEEKREFKILFKKVDGDHIHFYVEVPPNLTLVSVIRRMKQISTYYIWKQKDFSRYFWKEKTFWADGYFVSTIGEVSIKNLEEYIEKQGIHPRN
jgi:putative transposase